jgi:hypothetical protein
LKVRSWRRKALENEFWTSLVEETKAQIGFYSQEEEASPLNSKVLAFAMLLPIATNYKLRGLSDV